jgi:hypothetical protein
MKHKERLVYFLQEITIVVVGVLIAVSIGNYKQSMDNRNYIERTLLAIENEVRASQSAVESVLEKHLSLIGKVENELEGNDQMLGEMISDLGGVQFPVIKNISLRFFISNKAELIDVDVIAQLLEIELQTKILSDKMDRLADYSYAHFSDAENETKMIFAYLLSDVIDTEESLLESYARFLEENEAYLAE